MPRWQGKSLGSVLGYQIFVVVIKRLGVKPAYLLLRFVAAYFFLFSWTSSKYIFSYFRNQLGFGKIKSFFKIYTNYFIFGQTLMDKFIVMAGIPNNFTYHFDGEQHLHEIVAGGKGGILLSAHVGNWEAAGHLLKRLNTNINVVMYDGEQQRIKSYMDGEIGGKNFKIIVIKEDMSHVYAIGDALQKNELICLHADRYVSGNKTERISFLGSEAEFPSGPFLLAATFQVPVSIVFAFKETLMHYHLYGSSILSRGEQESKSEFRIRLMSQFVKQLQQKVKLYPEQWFNYYNFWT